MGHGGEAYPFTLQAGKHTLKVWDGESGTQLTKLKLLSGNAKFVTKADKMACVCVDVYGGKDCDGTVQQKCGKMFDIVPPGWKQMTEPVVYAKGLMQLKLTLFWRVHTGTVQMKFKMTFSVAGMQSEADADEFTIATFEKDDAGKYQIPCITTCGESKGNQRMSLLTLLKDKIDKGEFAYTNEFRKAARAKSKHDYVRIILGCP